MNLGVVARLSRGVDRAVSVRLGVIGLGSWDRPPGVAPNPEEFWASSRVASPASLRAHRRLGRGGRAIVDLVGPSDGPGSHGGARRLSARLVLPPGVDAPPVVLLVHGYAVPAPYYEDHHARLLLRRGIGAVRIDLPFHLHRRVPGRAHGDGFFSTDPTRTREVLRQSVEDCAAVVAWARANVSPRVGVMGVSLGGLVGSLLAATTPLESLVAVTPACDLTGILLELAPRRIRRELGLLDGGGGPWAPDAATARRVLDEELAAVTPACLRPATPGGRVTIVVADHDLIVGTDGVRLLATTWGADLWSYPHGHVTVMTARGILRRIHDRLEHDLATAAAPAVPAPQALAG